MEELGRRFAAAAPDVAVLVTPHSVHVDGHFAVVTAGRGSGRPTREPRRLSSRRRCRSSGSRTTATTSRPRSSLSYDARLQEIMASATYHGMLVAEIQTAA
jgi:hypothetical protein